ncbi:hypothetical protein MUN82_11835 [Hymenobacter aerilatus]|uniref:Uncharacterized protein n=1 Tax=Hymenobacter aerilatus TaxID=2932251 RepID=A0A8T9SV46_9BACT|nr:hypothetical protein [Hymenobacter aerilatus]UOR03639.1 hypothetical protein MUN82_11835 [Hymenobacter aerilatus]
MILAPFAFLPPSLQQQVAGSLRAEVDAHTSATDAAIDWIELLKTVNPVLRWSPASNSLELSDDSRQQLLHVAVPSLPISRVASEK